MRFFRKFDFQQLIMNAYCSKLFRLSAKPIAFVGMAWLLALAGCSSETPSTGQSSAASGRADRSDLSQTGPKSATSPLRSSPPVTASESQQPERKTFTRSELRVMEEETKNKEEEVRDLIKQFDANLDNPEGRRSAEEAMQKVLPEYKKNMLSVGKEKLNSLHQNR